MARSPKRPEYLAVGAFVVASLYALWPAHAAVGQTQQKCYYMECIGTFCFAYQIECPKTPASPPPIAPSTE